VEFDSSGNPTHTPWRGLPPHPARAARLERPTPLERPGEAHSPGEAPHGEAHSPGEASMGRPIPEEPAPCNLPPHPARAGLGGISASLRDLAHSAVGRGGGAHATQSALKASEITSS